LIFSDVSLVSRPSTNITLSSLPPQVGNQSSPQIPALGRSLKHSQIPSSQIWPPSRFINHLKSSRAAPKTKAVCESQEPRSGFLVHTPLRAGPTLSLEYRVPHAASNLCLCRSPTHPSNFACCASDLPPYAQCFFYLPLPTSAAPVRACKHLVFAVSYVTCSLCSMNYLLYLVFYCVLS
jgi:hypothetical protein